MARPKQNGLLYFSFDVDFFDDKEKIKPIIAKFGADGIALLIYLYCDIYKRGYYLKVDDDFINIASLELRMNSKKIRQMLAYFVSRSLFDNKLFYSVTALTSRSIQERYMLAVKERVRKSGTSILVQDKYWLVPDEDVIKVNVRVNNVTTSIKVIHFSDSPRKNDISPRKNYSNSTEKSLKESKVNKYIYILEHPEEIIYENEKLEAAFRLYLSFRLNNGMSVTREQVAILAEGLDSITDDVAEKIAIVKRATSSGWSDFFPITGKTSKKKTVKTSSKSNSNFEPRKYNMSDLEAKLLKNK